MKATKKQRKKRIVKKCEKGALKLSYSLEGRNFILNRRNKILWRLVWGI